MTTLSRAAILTAVSVAAGAGAALGQSFSLIEPAAGLPHTRMTGGSSDGSIVAGISCTTTFTTTIGYTWTQANGRFDFGATAGVPVNAQTSAISGDGMTVFGQEQSGSRIFRWTQSGGYQAIPGMPGHSTTDAVDASYDGSVIVGFGQNGGIVSPPTGRAYRWTQAGGYQDLGTLPGGGARVVAEGVSHDGNVIVGTNDKTSAGPLHAFLWTPQGGMQSLDANSPFFESEGRDVSGNGLVAVGNGAVPGSARPFRWTAETGMVDLGVPAGVTQGGTALHTNYDGSVIACAFNGPGYYVWSIGTGYTKFDVLLSQAGLSLPAGYSNLTIEDISDDGRTFLGEISLPGNVQRAYVAVVPSPSCITMFVSGLVIAASRRRR